MISANNIIQDKTILVVDDNYVHRKSLQLSLRRRGANVVTAGDGNSGFRKFHITHPDLVIMDAHMPNMDGLETIELIRLVSNVPIIFLSNASRDEDILGGFSVGVDDYVIKPCSHDVLIARVDAILRRSTMLPLPKQKVYDDGYLRIDLDGDSISVDGNEVKLTSKESRLLAYLYQHAGKRLSYDAILSAIWGPGDKHSPQYVHVYISRLRIKLEKNPKNPVYFRTEYGYGYRFKPIESTVPAHPLAESTTSGSICF